MGDFAELSNAVEKGDVEGAKRLTQGLLDSGAEAYEILEQGLVVGMDVVGEKFGAGEIFVPEMILAAMAMKAGLDLLRPIFVETGAEPVGRFVIGTVKGDVHDCGKNIVAMMFEGAGFDTLDLGVDVPAEDFIEAVKSHKANLLGLSALYTPTRLEMRNVVEKLKEAGLRDQVKVIVGGAPITPEFADMVGADGYARNAPSAVQKGKELLGLS
jgi:5-methyltetrahydrofolate--homocysteine methyltransferase